MCSTTLGSPTGPQNWSYVHVPVVPRPWHQRCTASCGTAGCTRGGYTGWVYRVGNTRAIPGTQPRCSGRGPDPAERAPEAQGLEWVGSGARAYLGTAAGTVLPHPAGPVGPGQPDPPWAGPCGLPPPGHIGRDLTSFSIKLVKTAECHRNVSKRPVIVPIYQNGSQKSPLDFLGFPISLAFSHKELMVPFEP